MNFCEPFANNVSPFADNVSRSGEFLPNNLSRKRQFLRAESLVFASRYRYNNINNRSDTFSLF